MIALTDESPIPEQPFLPRAQRSGADLAFRSLLIAAMLSMILALGGVLLFLGLKSWPAVRFTGFGILYKDNFHVAATPPTFGLGGALVGSLLIGVIALVVAVPLSVSTALVVNEYAPAGLRRVLVAFIDLLAIIPGIVFGIWGLNFFALHTAGFQIWLSNWASFFPPFRTPAAQNYSDSLLVCGILVGIMIIPTVTSVVREVMAQAPRDACEAALALGGTRWGMITDVILPFSRGGIIGGALLGLGRAAGETIAVVYILGGGQSAPFPDRILGPGSNSIPALIAEVFQTSNHLTQSALAFGGLALFAAVMAISLGARLIVGRAAAQARSPRRQIGMAVLATLRKPLRRYV